MDDIIIFCGSLFFATKSSATETPHLNYLNYLNYLPKYLPKESIRQYSCDTCHITRWAGAWGLTLFGPRDLGWGPFFELGPGTRPLFEPGTWDLGTGEGGL